MIGSKVEVVYALTKEDNTTYTGILHGIVTFSDVNFLRIDKLLINLETIISIRFIKEVKEESKDCEDKMIL